MKLSMVKLFEWQTQGLAFPRIFYPYLKNSALDLSVNASSTEVFVPDCLLQDQTKPGRTR